MGRPGLSTFPRAYTERVRGRRTLFFKCRFWGIAILRRGLKINMFKVQSCLSTTRPVITLIGCNAVGRASRFFGRQFFLFFLYIFYFFLILYIFLDCKLLYLLCTLPRCTFTTMSIVHLFVSVLLLYVGK